MRFMCLIVGMCVCVCVCVLYVRACACVQVVKRVRQVLQHEKIQDWNDGGIEAIVFTAQGDMRQVRKKEKEREEGMSCRIVHAHVNACVRACAHFLASIHL